MRKIAKLLPDGQLLDVAGVPCSSVTREEARRFGVPLSTLVNHPVIDVTIDEADEVDPVLI